MKKLACAIIMTLMLPASAYSKEFLNTVMPINFGLVYGLDAAGSIIDAERKFSIQENYHNEITNIKPDHYDIAYGVMVDVVPFHPFILGDESHAVKLGIRTGYRFHFLHQYMSVRNSDKDTVDYGGDLLKYRLWMVGPVVHYCPWIQPSTLGEYSASFGFTFFALWGPISNGSLEAFPSKRSKGDTVGNFKTTFDGYKVDVGVGGAFSICSVNLGVNLFYSFVKVKMKDQIYDSVGLASGINEVNLEFFFGIPVE